MIKIVEFKKYMQSSAKNFVINIMKEELNINNKDFMKVTEDLENIEEHYINRGGCFLVAYCKRKIIYVRRKVVYYFCYGGIHYGKNNLFRTRLILN